MFESARIKLTLWYVLLIMVISGMFSIAFYNASTRELQRIITRIEIDRPQLGNRMLQVAPFPQRAFPDVQELKEIKNKAIWTLIFLNGCILIFSGGLAYFLAGRTLRPIKEMMDIQNDFISHASHELRTPIAILRAEMEANLLEKKMSDTQARKLIQSNLEEVKKLQKLSDTLLSIIRTQTISQANTKQKISLSEVLQLSVESLSPLAQGKSIRIRNTARECVFTGNFEQVQEIFSILLDNAIKYSDADSTIRIRSQKSEKFLEVIFIDEGIGISHQDLPHIFESFYRANNSGSKRSGFGLGLSLAQKNIVAHGGTIFAESTLGKGSTFTVRFPL